MVKEIIINSSSTQTRVAITEDGNLVDFFVDYPENRRMETRWKGIKQIYTDKFYS